MKVFILSDLEGVSGVRGAPDETSGGNKILNHEQSCRLLVMEINAVASGLLAAGAEKIIVCDGHGGGGVIIEDLNPAIDLYQPGGTTTPVTVINSSYDAFIQIGAHSMMGTLDGFLSHTFSSKNILNMWLNNQKIGEIGITSLIVAYYGVPTLMVSGDRMACLEAKSFLGRVETVETKTAFNRFSAINYHPAKVTLELRNAAEKCLRQKEQYPANLLPPPYELKIQFTNPNTADIYEKTGHERIDAQTILIKSNDFIDLWSQRQGWGVKIHNNMYK